MTPMLSELPLELIEYVLMFADPVSVARFSQTCRVFFSLIYESENQHLWRSLFLKELFDDPRRCINSVGEPYFPDDSTFDWKTELKGRIRAEVVISNPTSCRSDSELFDVLQVLVSMTIHTPPASCQYKTEEISRNLVWLVSRPGLSAFLEYLQAHRMELPRELRQLASQLHTFVGLTIDDFSPDRLVKSRALVYDMRNYVEANRWGPFGFAGEVNWEHILAIQHVMAMHALAPEPEEDRDLHQILSLLPYCQAQLPKQSMEDDWAGVQGLWSCSFSFIDHREDLEYNETNPRDLSLFERPDFIEIFRSFRFRIRVTGTRPNPSHPTRPTVVFEGNVQDVHNVTGTVSVAEDGTVRWSFRSGEAMQLLWSSEGVQIGVAQSMFGVLGTWTTIFHEEGDPVGPFWLRKEIIDAESP